MDVMKKNLARLIDRCNHLPLTDYFKTLGIGPIASNADSTVYPSTFAPGPDARMTVDHETNTFTDEVTGTTGKVIDFISAWWGVVPREIFDNLSLYRLSKPTLKVV